jgi:hypothetical protein
MALTLAPSRDSAGNFRRERILAYGAPGTSKSYSWQRILAATSPDTQFFVIDTDGAWEPAASSDEFAPHADRVTHFEPSDWVDVINATKQAMKQMDRERGDWMVVDLADDLWEMAQEFYQDRKYAGDADSEEFMFALVDGSLGDDEDPMEKWGIINKLYAPFSRSLIKVPGNLFVCATAKELKKDNRGNYFRESKQNIKDFGGVGMRPGGQKNLSHDVNTVLFMSKVQKRWEFEKIKDRNRDAAWDGEESRVNGDFGRDFLMGICGWGPA